MKDLAMYSKMFDHFHEGIYIVDQHRKILYFNKEAQEITGFTDGDTVNTACYDNKLNHVDQNGNHLCVHGCPLLLTIKEGKYTEYHVFLHHKEGHRVPVHVKTIPILEDNKVVAAIEVFKETTEINPVKLHMDLEQIDAFVDPLTNAFNRQFYERNLTNLIDQITRKENIGVLFIDLDNFKDINDTYGHLIGDQLLKIASKTILNFFGSKDYVIRFGGDEFIVVMTLTSQNELIDKAEKVRVLVQNSILRDNNLNLFAKLSIGATMYQPNELFHDSIDRADQAMYQAKHSGKNKVCFI